MSGVAELLGLVLVEVDGILVQDMLDCVCPDFVMSVESMQMLESLGCPPQIVVDLEMATKFRKLLQLAQEGQIFTRILILLVWFGRTRYRGPHSLRLLGDEQGELQVIETQCVVVQLVRICQETHVLNCVICLFGRLFYRR